MRNQTVAVVAFLVDLVAKLEATMLRIMALLGGLAQAVLLLKQEARAPLAAVAFASCTLIHKG
jgi:hypothetical protein